MRNNDFAKTRQRFIADPGNPNHTVYSPQMEKDGSLTLVAIGEENTDEVIQSYYESTTLEVILAKFANGDMSALNKYQPIYMDVTQQPKTLAEALQKIINSHNAFDALPVDIKQKFDNDFNKWIASAGTEDWYTAMAPAAPDLKPIKDPEPAPAEKTE